MQITINPDFLAAYPALEPHSSISIPKPGYEPSNAITQQEVQDRASALNEIYDSTYDSLSDEDQESYEESIASEDATYITMLAYHAGMTIPA